MGYPLSVLKDLTSNSQWIEGRDVLTLGTLFPAVHNPGALGSLGLSSLSPLNQDEFSRSLLIGHLKAKSLSVLDVDGYQGAELIVNLNHPIENSQKSKFETVLDLGTLEHLSNFSTALTNIFDLLKSGGYYYFAIPSNNWLDHGFFQISPTFFIDLCKKNSGLKMKSLYLATSEILVEMRDLNKYARRAFQKTRETLIVCGVIEKISDSINLDLVQTRYASMYSNKSQNSADLSAFENTPDSSSLLRLRGLLSKTPGLSLKSRLAILNVNYR